MVCDGHRLEVQAEVTHSSGAEQHQKRASLSSESANFSIDAKSVTVSFGDNVSVVALAGSICARCVRLSCHVWAECLITDHLTL